ncbi:nucleotide-diphospho-sugar transferase [Pseudovirgaria hyperparasitica]|uniref:Nucleotide-diphospho-sugar transferase n=1 Tax=Pseudovirgaria hyperparasitica TaxID=470096 RepID=A0A6A6W8S5_9PEZI|nr:nucleotide-diphospho-sugar transferase [Pseudovirgaria hyperparasitica]KAF2757481.1 nucleotide-diphospho-sugar transferase [Pseudovirgaria hyperparasitica]
MFYSDRHKPSEYKVETLHKYDDHEYVKPWCRTLMLVHPVLIVWVFLTYTAYFTFRIWCNYKSRAVNGRITEASLMFVCLEGVCILPYLFYMSILVFSFGNRERPQLRLRGAAVPTVDVLLTTCGEAIPVIVNSVRAACNIDYPQYRYRVVVCDDSADPELQEALQPLLVEYPQLYYQARRKYPGVPHHYKAGNLQSGIDFVVGLPGGCAEYIATLDADMIAHPEWLRALLPHLLRDPLLGLISPPQTFWNVPADDSLCQSLCDFIHYLELKKDHIGTAWCTGSGVVMKRFIIDQIGGWPTPSMAEDQLLSCIMNGEGYKTAYCHEFLQIGMSYVIPAHTIPDHSLTFPDLKQRTRWAVGTLQTAQVLNWGFPGKHTKHMTFAQRWCIFTFAFTTLLILPQLLAFLALPTLLYWGRPLLVSTTASELRWQIRLAAIWICSLRLNDVAFALPSGYFQGQRNAMAWQFMMPYLAVAVVRCYVLPSWLGGVQIAFQASGAVRDHLMERSARWRAGLRTRIRLIGAYCHIWFFVGFVGFALGAGGTDVYRAWEVRGRGGDVRDALLHLLVRSCLPPGWWLLLATSFAVPVLYMFAPPTVPEWDEVMVVEPETGVGRPGFMEARQSWGGLVLVREIIWGVMVVYCVVLFAGTFVY